MLAKEEFMSEYKQVLGFLQAKNQSPIHLDPSRTALIIVDMQYNFTQLSYPLADLFNKLSPETFPGYLTRIQERIIPNTQRLLACFRNVGSPVVFTAVGSKKEKREDLACWLKPLNVLALSTIESPAWPLVNDPSWEIDEAIKPREGELVLNKLSAGAFGSTDLAQRLRDQGVETVIITGVATDVCVSTTAREAADRNFNTIVVSDACTAVSEQMHQSSLESLYFFGSIRTTEELIELVQETVQMSE